MLFSGILLPTFLSLALGVSAIPAGKTPSPSTDALHPIQRAASRNPGSYIVKFKKDVSQQSALQKLRERVVAATGNSTISVSSIESQITAKWSKDVLNGVSGKFDPQTLQALRTLPEVEYIAEDSIVSITTTVTQNDAPWGLQRISKAGAMNTTKSGLLTYKYTYDDTAGSGVDVYVLDTGVRTTHTQFGGRAKFGAAFPSTKTADGNGHGTHCACTIAGSRYGVAKKTNVIGVKVLPDTGSGPTSNVLSGIDWIIQAQKASGRPSVVSMSFAGSADQALDDAAESLVSNGIHVVVAAGNNNRNASTMSPARSPGVISVGATTISDTRASYSNYGPAVDIFAPGSDVISCGISNDNASKSLSGTSMAAPHVAGLVAYLLSRYGSKSPAEMQSLIQQLGKDDVIRGLPKGTRNDLACNDIATDHPVSTTSGFSLLRKPLS